MARYDFVVPASTSLKDKRRVVKSLTSSIRGKFNVSVAEVDYVDLRQRGAVGLSCVSNSSFHARKVLMEIERFIRAHYEIEIVDVYTEVATPDA